MGRPETLSGPPADIARRKITIVEFADSIFRTHLISRQPIFYGRTRQNRFDSPDGTYGVLYAGRDPYCAFIETFAKAAGASVVTTTELRNRCLSELNPGRVLHLIDLTQSGTLVRLGADARLFSAEHSVSRAWSKAFYDHPSEVDGLLYPSRLDPTRHALAIFEGRVKKMVELRRQSWYDAGAMRHLLAQIVDHYDLALVEEKVLAPRKPTLRAVQPRLL